MRISPTFYRYIGQNYLSVFLGLLFIMMGIIFMFDLIELLRRAGNKENIEFISVLGLALLKLPEVSQKLFPFAILFSAIFTFWRLTRSSELIVARAAGFSVWQFLTPVLSIAILIGLLKIIAINPVSAVFLSKFERLEAKYFNSGGSLIDVKDSGLWLKQSIDDQSEVILHAKSFSPKTWILNDVSLFEINNGLLSKRYDSDTTILRNGYWQFKHVTVHDFQTSPVLKQDMTLPTSITPTEIQDSFASPDTISFWKLRSFTKSMEDLGFPTTKLKIYYQSLLADPLLFAAMVLLAASVSLRPPRRGRIFIMITSGVVIGFLVFILDNFLQAYGLSEKISPFVSAWAAPSVTFVFGLSALLYLEEG